MRFSMRISLLGFIAAACLWAVPATPSPAAPKKEVIISAAQLHFEEAVPGVSKATLWGDPAKGSYGAITRFAKGTKVALHTHSHDIKIVVISGTLVYGTPSGGEKRLGPGSFLHERGGIQHTTAAADDSELMFFEESTGAFDLKIVK